LQQLADLWAIVFPDGLLPVIDGVYRQHQELMGKLEELAVPSEVLMLDYFKSLSPTEVVSIRTAYYYLLTYLLAYLLTYLLLALFAGISLRIQRHYTAGIVTS
jgi:hypothetical protein